MVIKKVSFFVLALSLLFLQTNADNPEKNLKYFVETKTNYEKLKNFIIDWENNKEQTPQIFHEIFEDAHKKYELSNTDQSEASNDFLQEIASDITFQVIQKTLDQKTRSRSPVSPTKLFSPFVKAAIIILCFAATIKLITSIIKDIKQIAKKENDSGNNKPEEKQTDANKITKDIADMTENMTEKFKNTVTKILKKNKDKKEEKPIDTEKMEQNIIKNVLKGLEKVSSGREDKFQYSMDPHETGGYEKVNVESNSDEVNKTLDRLEKIAAGEIKVKNQKLG